MAIIDFHSHVLPAVDDGSKDIVTSLKILETSAGQRVDLMVATPHFYASRYSIEKFLQKRNSAYARLQPQLPAGAPKLRLGAEVAYFRGISKAEKLNLLTIEGTNLLLLEMPFVPWEESDIQEVQQILDRGYRVLLAHLERYLDLPGNKRWVSEIQKLDVKVQINAESLLNWRKKRRLIHMFRDGEAHVLGSDCHGMHHRPPNLGAGRAVLEKKLGQDFLKHMDEEGSKMLQI